MPLLVRNDAGTLDRRFSFARRLRRTSKMPGSDRVQDTTGEHAVLVRSVTFCTSNGLASMLALRAHSSHVLPVIPYPDIFVLFCCAISGPNPQGLGRAGRDRFAGR